MERKTCQRCSAYFDTYVHGQTKCSSCRKEILHGIKDYNNVQYNTCLDAYANIPNGQCAVCLAVMENKAKRVCDHCSGLIVKFQDRGWIQSEINPDFVLRATYVHKEGHRLLSGYCNTASHGHPPCNLEVNYDLPKIFGQNIPPVVYFNLEDKYETCGNCKQTWTLTDVKLVKI